MGAICSYFQLCWHQSWLHEEMSIPLWPRPLRIWEYRLDTWPPWVGDAAGEYEDDGEW